MISVVATNGRWSEDDDERYGRLLRRRAWILGLGIPLALVLIVLVMHTAGMPVLEPAGGPPLWQQNLGFAISVVAFVIIVVSVVRVIRAGMFSAAYRARARSISLSRRSRALRPVLRGGQVPDAEMPVALEAARGLVHQQRALPIYVGVVLTSLGAALQGTSPWRVWLVILSAASILTVTIISSSQAHRAQRWLDAQPQQTASETAGF